MSPFGHGDSRVSDRCGTGVNVNTRLMGHGGGSGDGDHRGRGVSDHGRSGHDVRYDSGAGYYIYSRLVRYGGRNVESGIGQVTQRAFLQYVSVNTEPGSGDSRMPIP